MVSPYHGLSPDKWHDVTVRLVEEHPLRTQEIIDIVLGAWQSIFASKFGKKSFRIGIHILPKPQIMGFLLHELIPLELATRYPKLWCKEGCAGDKDVVYMPDERFSLEIKTSSNPQHIFGNRSYAQNSTKAKKAKSGYYLAVNFEKFSSDQKKPKIVLIRFGWIDSSDWIGQRAATGQQSRLGPNVENYKLLKVYEA